MKKRIIYFILLIGAVLLCTSCRMDKEYEASGNKLNTYVKITLYEGGSQRVADDALKLCDYYENIFSATIAESNLSVLNKEGSLVPTTKEDEALAELIDSGLYYGRLTEGALDITIRPVSRLWDFGNDDEGIPDSTQLKAALEKVDYTKVTAADEITLNGTELDLGAIAKGYIADRIGEYLTDNGVTSALINLGGNVLCVGDKPDGSDFVIGIQNPFGGSTDIIVGLNIEGKSVVTSGVYERYFYENGILYHHILNPDTGMPCDNGLLSVTIISDQSIDGDCLSTGCFVLGMDRAMELIDSLDNIYAIFIDSDYNIHYSEGAEEYIHN